MLAWTSTKPCSLWRARHGRTRGHIQGNPKKSQIAALTKPRVGVSAVILGSSATCGCQWLMVLTKLTFSYPCVLRIDPHFQFVQISGDCTQEIKDPHWLVCAMLANTIWKLVLLWLILAVTGLMPHQWASGCNGCHDVAAGVTMRAGVLDLRLVGLAEYAMTQAGARA